MPNIKHRNPKEIMTLSRLGSFYQSKLSFLRSFIREFKDWEFNKDLFDLDENGYGTAVYSVKKDRRAYSLVCFANKLNSADRSDRVIATKWDAAFVLHDGVPTKDDIDRLKVNVPKQEVGRVSFKELTLSRANKSVRFFEHTVDALASGKQPDEKFIKDVGYLYRTTAVYGSGKFGLADRYRIKERSEICGPFRLEMMLVYLVRQFTFDQVNHMAKSRNPTKAVKLSDNIARNLGIGNSTGLGMAPFIVNHPTLLHNWIYSREDALKQIRSIEKVEIKDFNKFKECFKKSKLNINTWKTDSEYQINKINILEIDFNSSKEIANFWFISKNKEEPRLANRYEEEGSELEQPLAIARDVSKLFQRLNDFQPSKTIAEFLMANNDLRHAVRRCFIIEKFPYSEIQDNTIGSELVPIDMLRLKLSFFGAQKFDPRSDKWLRINMYQGAPLINELKNTDDTWVYNRL